MVGGRYRVIQSLGRGGMGEVFRAIDVRSDRELALKRFRLDLDQHEDLLRFRREFHTLARLRHPRIVEAYDFGIEDGRPFYTMELLDGNDFGDLSPLPWKQACPLLRDVASALAFLHARRLLHRDIAPRNARCTARGRAKLLDFGMLATMGATTEIVGTVHSIAPEMILGFPMDGRADLFGFGALAFWLLTGRHPRRARSLNDLVRDGHTRAPRPSSIEPSVPGELDDLVLSLLSHEPLGRPASAAEVIDRLTAIGDLPPADELEVVRGYVRSADLVGRKHELEVVRKRLMRAMAGSGGTVVIEARSGMGKTRFLHEVELEAKLAGALVLRGQAEGGGPYALLRQLGIDRSPVTSGDHVVPEHSVIGRLLGDESDLEIGDTGATLVGTVPSRARAPANDLREERLELQSALGERIAALAERRPLVVIVDDLQRADEGSASALASLAYEARERRILLVCALRSDERIGARRAVAKIRDHAIVLHPGGLGSAELEQLLRSMFGDVPNLERLAGWLRRQAGGSPMHCIEIVRHLVDHEVLREQGGAWVIPERFTDEGLPRGLAEAMDARVRGLDDAARALGRVLSVHGGWVPLRTCIALSAPRSDEQVFAALAELERADILVGTGERWALRHDGLCEAFLRDIDALERSRLELLIGHTLLAEGSIAPEREAAVGWHLLRGGERLRGARMLARAGKRLFEATSFADAIAPLAAALEVYSETRSNPYTRVRLSDMLHTAGFYSDRETAVRYRDPTVDLLARYSGVHAARRLRRLGWRTAFVLAFVWAWLLFVIRPPGRRGPAPLLALRMYLRAVVFASGVCGFSFDTAGLRRCVAWLEPLEILRNTDLANALRFVHNLLAFNLGRVGTIRRNGTEDLRRFIEQPGYYSIAERRLVFGGATFQRGLAAVRTGDPDALGEIAALERLETRLWSMGALQLRSHYHLWRGEDDEARRVWADAELEFVRLGSLWQLEAVHHASACGTAAFVGDGLGLKRHIEALARQVAAGMNYRAHLDLARGEYAKLRG
ncbi:MAG TPA: protein kinase, partial [Nannocystaceae bacterium]|nr:protein kinase [Nannocystaceae bacterium]